MPSGMPALISPVSRSLIAPVLRSVSLPVRAVLPRPFPDLRSVKSQRFHGGCTSFFLRRICFAGYPLPARFPVWLLALYRSPGPWTHQDNLSQMNPWFCSLGYGDTFMNVLGIG